MSSFIFLKNGLQEEELGPLPLLSERNGPCVQTRLRKGCSVDTGQEMLYKGTVIVSNLSAKTLLKIFRKLQFHENFEISDSVSRFLPLLTIHACTRYIYTCWQTT